MTSHKFIAEIGVDVCLECGLPESHMLHVAKAECPCCGYPNCGHTHDEAVAGITPNGATEEK